MGRTILASVVVLGLLAAAGILVVSGPVEAAFPGTNGKIAFVSDRDGNEEIYTMNPDGSGQTRLSTNAARDAEPAWSPNGRKIAFVSTRTGSAQIHTMNADGSGVRRLGGGSSPAWSPGGTQLVFERRGDLYRMRADGAAVKRVTASRRIEQDPAWSPNGKKIALTVRTSSNDRNSNGVFVMNPNGTGLDQITPAPPSRYKIDNAPNWSPDGKKIAFRRFQQGGTVSVRTVNANGTGERQITAQGDGDDRCCAGIPAFSPDGGKIVFSNSSTIYTVNADGTNQTQLTFRDSFGVFNNDPDWQPRP
jgi:Tol biopolymer transport system component